MEQATVELSPVTVSLLRSHRQRQTQERLRRGAGWQDHGLVFPSVIGTPWFKRMFYRDYRTALERSGVDDTASITWHTLRHTAATQWLRHGADVFSVSRRLGHASAAFTMDVYGDLLKGQQRQAATALDRLLANWCRVERPNVSVREQVSWRRARTNSGVRQYPLDERPPRH